MKSSVNKRFSASSRVRGLCVAACSAAVVVAATGCSDATDDTATPTRTATSTIESAPSGTSRPTTPAAGGTEISTATDTAPGPDTAMGTETVTAAPTVDATQDGTTPCVRGGASVIVGNAITQIAPPVPGGQWVPGDSNFDSCADFTYVTLDTIGGTVSSPQQLMFFHYDEFLGTGTACNLGYQQVTGADDNQIHVTYGYIVGDEPNAAPQGRVSVTYQWNGSAVEMIGELPPAVTGGNC